MMHLLVAAAVPIATFDGNKATTYQWQPVNDPVMGGQSTSTFHVDADKKLGIWEGEVKIVPFLKAPGFCNLQAPGLYKTAEFPDLSGTDGLVARFSATGLTQYNVMLQSKGSRKLFRTGVYMANFTTTDGLDHFVPWSAFKCSYHGEPVDWCPELSSQLAEIDSIGLGTAFPGKAGKFRVELASLSAQSKSPVEGAAGDLVLATFDGKQHKWHTENDPVMGGQSSSTFKEPGDYQGVCRDVPSLKAPGFTILMTEGPLFGHFPDVSGYDGLTLKGKNVGGNVTTFKLAFCDAKINFYRCQFASFKADISLPAGVDSVFVPWSKFSDKWDSATGKHTAEEPPTKAALSSVTQLQIWVEGVAGDFHLQLDSVSATKQGAVLV